MSGDIDANFTALVVKFQPTVFRWAVGFVRDKDEANDVMQETFVSVYRSLDTFRGEGSFEAWLYRITRRIALRRAHRGRRRTNVAAIAHANRTSEVYLTDPGARVDRETLLGLVADAVAQLPNRQREIFELCDVQGSAPHEVSDLLGVNPSTVRANLFKARSAVRRTLLESHPQFRRMSE